MTWLKQNWIKTILAFLIFVSGLFFLVTTKPIEVGTEQNKANIISVAKTPTPNNVKDLIDKECKRMVDDQSEESAVVLNNNKFALKILEDECLWVMDYSTLIADFDGDGKDEIAMITSGAGCGSCHGQEIRIIKDDQVTFYKDGVDFTIELAEDFIGFLLKEPVWKNAEPFCCPSESIVESYKFNTDKKFFYKIGEHRIIKISEGMPVDWNGVVVAKMTYGRIRVEKIPKDEQYPYFIVEDYNGAKLGDYTGKVNIQGVIDSIDCNLAPANLGLKEGQCVPWVIIEKINKL